MNILTTLDVQIIEILDHELGPTVVAASTDTDPHNIAIFWRNRTTAPDCNQMRRLRAAYNAFMAVADQHGSDIARDWFIAGTPTIFALLRDDQFEEVARRTSLRIEETDSY